MAKQAMPKEPVKLRQEEERILKRFDALRPKPMDKELAQVAGITKEAMSNIRRGIRKIQLPEVRRIERWLDEKERHQATGNIGSAPDIPPTRSADAGETAAVMRLDLSYAMGPGTDLDAAHVEGEPVLFDIAFLRSLTPSPPDQLRIVTGIGDSMLPTIHDREALIIDLNQSRLNMQDRIWAIALYGAGAVKRLRTISKQRVLVISDNPDVPNQEVDASDVFIAARVVGSLKRH
jgi:phage repressor protein C with HTH and peptisase S24 domain